MEFRYLFDRNTDDALRQSIMGIEARYAAGGVERFSGMAPATLDRLAEHGFIDMDASHNGRPTAREFRDFMERWRGEGATTHGYIVSPERHDYDVVIEGLEARSGNMDFRADFISTFEGADELECEMAPDFDAQRCWYD